MASFDPPVVLSILAAAQPAASRKKFVDDYEKGVKQTLDRWKQNRSTQSQYLPQLTWEAHVAEYVTVLYRETRPPPVAKTSNKISAPKALKAGIPIYGPKFIPPSFTDIRLRMSGKIKPGLAYLRPINIIHPVYYPNLRNCPFCGSDDVKWDSWNQTGSREVHGVNREETALGYQLRHENCTEGGTGEPRNRCVATTNHAFWKNREHWNIPRGIPYFFSRCAVTRDLFNLIIELRLTELHLLEYHELLYEYLQAYQKAYAAPGALPFSTSTIEPFSAPGEAGYNDTSITNDTIRAVYMAFCENTRSEESDEYLRNLRPGVCLGADNTFKAAAKATIVDASKTRTKLMKGGILSMLNEVNETVTWRFCQSASPAEMFEVLEGLKRRCEELGVNLPEMIVVDNCCQVEKEIRRALPEIAICLDVYHFMMRYLAAIINGTNNPHRTAVATDIRNAVLKNSASKGILAQYWTKEEQETKMIAVYEKYSSRGDVWSAAAHAVHAAQLKHLRKGCLSRPRQDIASDGSRIEGSHKGWNSIQRGYASGLEFQNAAGHDLVLRRNVRITFARKPENVYGRSSLADFVASSFGSHHTRLVNANATVFNSILETEAARRKSAVLVQSLKPTLKHIVSGETFGLVQSQHSDTFNGLLTIKPESSDEDHLLNDALDDSIDPGVILDDLNIDPSLLFQPLQAPSNAGTAAAEAPPSTETSSITVVENQSLAAVSIKRKEPEASAPPETLTDHPKSKKQRIGAKVPLGGTSMHEGASTSAAPHMEQPLHPLFKPNTGPVAGATSAGSTSRPNDQIAGLMKLLPLPVSSHSVTPRLTRSEQLFSRTTGTNPKSLQIGRDAEFFLFMNMREEFRWKSSDMTSIKWVDATQLYNERLGSSGVAKSPRALSSKLGEMERAILERLSTQKFTSQKGGEAFWRKHCFSVPLIKVDPSAAEKDDTTKVARAGASCKRCNKLMYPGPSKSPENHKKGYCSDGFKQKIVGVDESAPWPQPDGIFTAGSNFHPLIFLATLREVYDKSVIQADIKLTMDHEAFLAMLQQPGRVITSGGAVLFRMFSSFIVPPGDPTPDLLFTEQNGANYLRIDALQDSDLTSTSE
ncbi:hypothetical protein C8R43DRAFT_947636 [Mycena crocata]|nr:hypothetical protein C8R43DRAFT_947636 [Mycena crocata]